MQQNRSVIFFFMAGFQKDYVSGKVILFKILIDIALKLRLLGKLIKQITLLLVI